MVVERMIGRVQVAEGRTGVMRVHQRVVVNVRGVVKSHGLAMVVGERWIMKKVQPVSIMMGLDKLVNGTLVLTGMVCVSKELVVRQARNVCNVPHGVIEVGHLRQMGGRGSLGGDHEEIACVPRLEELLHGIARQRLSGARITDLDHDMLRIPRVDPRHNDSVVGGPWSPSQSRNASRIGFWCHRVSDSTPTITLCPCASSMAR
jgi:hypothetical protein